MGDTATDLGTLFVDDSEEEDLCNTATGLPAHITIEYLEDNGTVTDLMEETK